MGLSDFLFGKNKWDIDKEYDSSIRDARKAANQAMMNDAYNKAFVNQSKNNASIAHDAGMDVDAIRNNDWDKFEDSEGKSQTYSGYIDALRKEQDRAWARNKYNVLGNGMIGSIVTPYIQVADIAKDMLSSPFRAAASEETNRYIRDPKNDFLSDIGAMGEVGFDVAGMGALGDAVKGGTKLTSNLGKTALRTGVLGAGENASSTIREQGQDTDWGDVALSGAIGGAFGGGLGAISQFGGNAANIAKQVRSPQMQALNGYYQQALAGRAQPLNPARMLGDGVGGASVGTAGNYLDWVPKQAKAAMERSGTPLARTGLGRVAQGIADSRAIYGSPLSSIANSRLGQTTRNILKTPAGKIGAGVGGGLLVANLLRGGGQPNTEMTDEELYQLLNNYNNGGY